MGKCTKKALTLTLTDVSVGVRTHTPSRSRRLMHNPNPNPKQHALIPTHHHFSPPPEQPLALEIQPSGDSINSLDFHLKQRGGRESNPRSLNTAKRTCSVTARRSALVRNAPPADELDEFFTREEQSIQRRFLEKYNFDIVRDLPLRGRYEWVAVRP